MKARIIQSLGVSTTGGTQRTFVVRTAGRLAAGKIAKVYNQRINPELEGCLSADPEQIDLWLSRDPECLHLGFLDGQLVSLLKIVRLGADVKPEIPSTRLELTANETLVNVNPDKPDRFFCPWVTAAPGLKEFFADDNGQPRGLLQLQIRLALREARSQGATRFFAYARPVRLRDQLTTKLGWLGMKLGYFPNAEGRNPVLLGDGAKFKVTASDLCLHGFNFVHWLSYWKLGQDPELKLHRDNGARLEPSRLLAAGERHDQRALGFRIPLEYQLGVIDS